MDFDTKLIHADTTSFGVHGMYENDDIGNTIEITLGHPKDGRTDLKQWVLFHSTPMQQRVEKTFEKQIEKKLKLRLHSLRNSMTGDLHVSLMREKKPKSGYRTIKL